MRCAAPDSGPNAAASCDARSVTHSHADIQRILDAAGHSPRRSFGQNYVGDPNTVRRIAALASVGPGDLVVEIGAGLGSLTLALHETGAEVIAVEVDTDVVPVLEEVLGGTDIEIVSNDARTIDWEAMLGGRRASVVANLPYNIATPLVLDLLDHVPLIRRYLVMVQREAGERLAASAGSRIYGIPSVKVAYWGTAKIVGSVPASVFVPRPKVESVLVEIIRGADPAIDAPLDRFTELVRAAFGQRRKMLRRSLAELVSDEDFAAASIDPSRRPETLTPKEWGALAAIDSTLAR